MVVCQHNGESNRSQPEQYHHPLRCSHNPILTQRPETQLMYISLQNLFHSLLLKHIRFHTVTSPTSPTSFVFLDNRIPLHCHHSTRCPPLDLHPHAPSRNTKLRTMSLTRYSTVDGLPPYGGKPPAPVEIPNPNRRFITLSGEPPYGGVPPDKRPPKPESPPSYAIATAFPLYHSYSMPIPAPSPLPSPPEYRRVESPPQPCPPAPPPPTPPPRYEPIPQPAPATQRFEPPGCKLYGHTPTFSPGANFSYIFPSAHITLQYWDDGTQPWLPNGSSLVSRRVVPSCMSVKDLIRQLGAPAAGEAGRDYGVTVTKLRVRRGDSGEEREFGDVEEGIGELRGLAGRGVRSWWCWGRGETCRLGDWGDRTLGSLGWKGVVGVAVWVS